MTAPAWHDDRACRDLPVAMFFPVATYGAGPGKQSPDYGPAQAVCNRCSVKPECYAYAVHHGDIDSRGLAVHGVIAGVAPVSKSTHRRSGTKVCALPTCNVVFYGSTAQKFYCCPEHTQEGRFLSKRDNRRTA